MTTLKINIVKAISLAVAKNQIANFLKHVAVLAVAFHIVVIVVWMDLLMSLRTHHTLLGKCAASPRLPPAAC